MKTTATSRALNRSARELQTTINAIVNGDYRTSWEQVLDSQVEVLMARLRDFKTDQRDRSESN